MRNMSMEKDLVDVISNITGIPVEKLQVMVENSKKKLNNTVESCTCKTSCKKKRTPKKDPRLSEFIDKIIAQDTATIIFWKDGTKTSVKCGKEDKYDYEKGIAMATLKYMFGNKYYSEDMVKLMEKYPYTKSDPKKKTKKPKVNTEKKPRANKKTEEK
jgi:hypothetical protein